jgi:vacuolar-type H+-ATPase subunit E/Vma4
MSYDKERLLSFKELILNNTKEKAEELKSKTLQDKQEELERITQQSLRTISSQTEEKIKKIQTDYKYEINKKNLDINKNFLSYRNKLIKELIDLCKENIKDFTKTQEYEKYVMKKLEKNLNNSNLNNVIVKIKNEDVKFEKEILKIKCVEKIEVDTQINLGGIKIIE